MAIIYSLIPRNDNPSDFPYLFPLLYRILFFIEYIWWKKYDLNDFGDLQEKGCS